MIKKKLTSKPSGGSSSRRLGRSSVKSTSKRSRDEEDEDEDESVKKGSGRGWMKKGKDITREETRLVAENERRTELRKKTGGLDPNKGRFRLKPGESADVVILDEDPDTVAFYEHNLRQDGHFGNFEACPGEWSNCPVCSTGDNKYFVWFLTVLDTRGYEKQDGTEVEYVRRLLPIKQTQATAYKRVLRAAMKEHGTIRGVVLTLERDTNERSASIGEPVIMESGGMYDFMDEDDLLEEFGHAAIKSTKSGEVLVKKNGLISPFDYDAIFTKPDAKEMSKRLGLGSTAGSDEEYAEAGGRSKKKKRRVIEDAEEDEDEDEEEDPDGDEEDEPVRRKFKATKKVAKKKAKRRVVDEDDDEDGPPF